MRGLSHISRSLERHAINRHQLLARRECVACHACREAWTDTSSTVTSSSAPAPWRSPPPSTRPRQPAPSPSSGSTPGSALRRGSCNHADAPTGDVLAFPLNAAVNVVTQRATFTAYVPDDGLANDWLAEIRNVGGIAWVGLFFVVDLVATLENADGHVIDVLGTLGVAVDAMRIDGTVTLGGNANLPSESMGSSEILEPGESWCSTCRTSTAPRRATTRRSFSRRASFQGRRRSARRQ